MLNTNKNKSSNWLKTDKKQFRWIWTKTAVDRRLTFYAALSPDHTQYYHFHMFLVHVVTDKSDLGLCRTIPRSQQKVYSVPRTSDVQQSHLINEKRWQKTLTISHRRQCGKSQGRSLSAYRRAHTRAQALFLKKDHNVHNVHIMILHIITS